MTEIEELEIMAAKTIGASNNYALLSSLCEEDSEDDEYYLFLALSYKTISYLIEDLIAALKEKA